MLKWLRSEKYSWDFKTILEKFGQDTDFQIYVLCCEFEGPLDWPIAELYQELIRRCFQTLPKDLEKLTCQYMS